VQAAQKTIVLTGASRGLGLALARELVRLGHHVEACSRSVRDSSELEFALQEVDISGEVLSIGRRPLAQLHLTMRAKQPPLGRRPRGGEIQ
jgi:NAD(P)-dependent dehydrogenase (short-subunit alcohol dehydrogenase family)